MKKRLPKMNASRNNSTIPSGEEGEHCEAPPHLRHPSGLKKKERNLTLRIPLVKMGSLDTQAVEGDSIPRISRLISRSLKAD